jgi:hypothetical protein
MNAAYVKKKIIIKVQMRAKWTKISARDSLP